MKTITLRSKRVGSLLAASAGLIALASAAQAFADVTVVYSVTGGGGGRGNRGGGPGGPGAPGAPTPTTAPATGTGTTPATPGATPATPGPGGPGGGRGFGGTNTVTLYFKGANIRKEDSRGRVTIFSAKDKAVYILNPNTKTYFVQPAPPTPPAAAAGATTPPPPMSATLTVSKLDPTVADNVKQIAGKQAGQYSLAGTVTLPGRPNADGDPPPPATVTGSLWLSDAVKLPVVNDMTLSAVAGVTSSGRQNPLGTAIAANLKKSGDIPLETTISITLENPDTGDKRVMTSSATVQSVKTDVLDASLFAIPTGYTKTDAPQMPAGGWGGRNGGGRNGGGRRGGGGGGAGGDNAGGGAPMPPPDNGGAPPPTQ